MRRDVPVRVEKGHGQGPRGHLEPLPTRRPVEGKDEDVQEEEREEEAGQEEEGGGTRHG